jgi:hypothetical protein
MARCQNSFWTLGLLYERVGEYMLPYCMGKRGYEKSPSTMRQSSIVEAASRARGH